MKQWIFTLTFISFFANIFAQNSATFPKNKYADIFNSVFLQNKNLYGIFDSTDSWLVVHQDTAFQSEFDSVCLRCQGKTWHRGQIVSSKSYFTIMHLENVLHTLKNSTDSLATEDSVFLKTLISQNSKGLEVWKCEGEYFVNEDLTSQYSGRFAGTFSIYFLYNRKSNLVLSANHITLQENAPSALFNGFWRSYKNKKQAGIPFFWSNKTAVKSRNNSFLLPDLRLQPDGSFSFANMASFDERTVFPIDNWYQ